MKNSLPLLFNIFAVLPGSAFANYSVSHAHTGSGTRVVRHLSPALRPDTLSDRSAGTQLLKKEASFEYLEAGENAKRDGSTFSTTLTVGGQQSILALEDLEEDLHKVSCSDSEIDLQFDSSERLDEVGKELKDAAPFVAITSHPGCNNDDERSPHCVEDTTVDKANKAIKLSTTSCKWEDAFSSVEISFSRRDSSATLRTRNAKNQLASGATPVALERREKFPSPTAEPSTLPSDSGTELDMNIKDKQILPPKLPGIDLASLAPFPEGVALTCKRCSLEGNVDLSQGRFKVGDSDNIIEDATNTVDFFQHGAIQLDVNGMFANVELGLEFDASVGLFNYSVPLPSIPITPFAIPGVIEFGIILTPQILVNLELNEALEFSYGFNLSVPDHSGFTIDVGDLGNSSISGFDKTSFNPLPFQSSQGIPNLVFSISFTPEILLGVHSPIGSASGGIGAFFNLPRAIVNITQLDNVDENCKPKSGSDDEEDENSSLESALEDLVGNFTHVVPSVELNMGPLAELEVGIAKFETEIATRITALKTEFQLPTACLAFDEENKTYGAPSSVITPTGDAGGDGGEGAGNPDEKKESLAGRVDPGASHAVLRVCTALVAVALVVGIGL